MRIIFGILAAVPLVMITAFIAATAFTAILRLGTEGNGEWWRFPLYFALAWPILGAAIFGIGASVAVGIYIAGGFE